MKIELQTKKTQNKTISTFTPNTFRTLFVRRKASKNWSEKSNNNLSSSFLLLFFEKKKLDNFGRQISAV